MPVQPKEGKATMDPRQSSITDAFAAVPGLAEECLLAEEPLLPHPQMECGREAAPMRPATSYILFCPRCPSDDPMSTRAKVSALPNTRRRKGSCCINVPVTGTSSHFRAIACILNLKAWCPGEGRP